MGLNEICSTCCCQFKKEVPKEEGRSKRRMSYKNAYCPAGFLPECVRKVLQETKPSDNIPLSIRLFVVLLSCEVPAIPEVIDLYSISSSYSIADVMDELRMHFTGIMKRLVSEGGDVIYLKNGLLECIWPVNGEDLKAVSSTALNTALAIQQEAGVTRTKIGYDLKNKIGITVGDIEILFVGSGRIFHVAAGDVQMEVKAALKNSGMTQVIVTKTFWKNISSKESYQFKPLDEEFLVVHSTTESLPVIDEVKIDDEYQRLCRNEYIIGDELIKYFHPFQICAKTSQQLHILTSMSQVVYIAVRAIDFDRRLLDRLHQATNIISEIVEEHEGILGKIINQVDLTFCIVFGYPGYKHKDDAVRSVLCAQRIFKSMQDIEMNVAIAISSGMLFCGILGFELRQECCALGMAVHLALNIVNQMPDFQLICCINTFFRTCRVLGEIFTPVRRRLKGVKSSNLFFKISLEEVQKFDSKAKCVGRKKEKEMITNALKELKDGMKEMNTLLPLINITGKLGTGKSSLLNWVIQEGRNIGYRVTARVDNNVFEEPNENAWSIVKQVLTSQLIDKESKIMELLGPEAGKYPLQLLNRRLNLSFSQQSLIVGEESAREMMLELIKRSCHGEPVLIGLDNAEHTGTESWMFLQCLLVERRACLVSTFTEEFSTSVPFVRHLISSQYLGVHLSPFEGADLGAFACHVLNVSAIHKGFLDFLQEQSGGNAVHLREILMMPPLQKHFCLVSHVSVTDSTLAENFVMAEEADVSDPYNARVCDILDAEGLWSIKIPKQLLDIFKDRSASLNPEEQMLTRKCSLLGDTFGLRILEAVSPEFTSNELYPKVYNLVEKQILVHMCQHYKESRDCRKISVKDAPLDYCVHPLRFVSEFLKDCIVSSMAKTQRLRLDLYLADLLRDESDRECDACRREREIKKSRNELIKRYKIPNIDFRMCRCLNSKTDILIQEAFHLEHGEAPISKRLDVLLEGVETAIDAREITKAEDILNKMKRLMVSYKSETQPDYVEIAIERLKARLRLRYGHANDSLRFLKHAYLAMNVVFPADVRKGSYRNKRYSGRLGEEESKCQSLGGSVLLTLNEYGDACLVAKQNIHCLLQESAGIHMIIDANVLYLRALMKTAPGKERERKSRKLMNEIKQLCFKRLTENPELNVRELRSIIRAFRIVVILLFETAELDAAEELGCKSFQVLKLVNHPKQVARICFFRAQISFYAGHFKKCLEMLSELQDAHQQSGDTISEVLYHLMLVKVVREGINNVTEDEITMCYDYANQGIIAFSCHPKHNRRIFYLSAAMALWCLENKIMGKFQYWYDQAASLRKDIRLNSFMALSGAIYMMKIEIKKVKENSFVFTREEIMELKEEKLKAVENIQKQTKDYIPVLEKDAKELEKYVQNAFKDCKVLRN